MSAEKPEHANNLRPGQHDEGGHGGMATRELEAHERQAEEQQRAEEGTGPAGD